MFTLSRWLADVAVEASLETGKDVLSLLLDGNFLLQFLFELSNLEGLLSLSLLFGQSSGLGILDFLALNLHEGED